ncbi:MAG: hypothetical protein PWQ91_1782 [Eubacteriales bacterium]|nr:hypothetical protein [Eubacteriales bacterium]
MFLLLDILQQKRFSCRQKKSCLLPKYKYTPVGYYRGHWAKRKKFLSPRKKENGAEDGIRTRDPRLGKAMLYP